MRGRVKPGAKSPKRLHPEILSICKETKEAGGRRQKVRPCASVSHYRGRRSAAVAAPTALAAPDPEIAALQVSLRSKGMYFGKIDGVAGPMTAKGLRAFQRARAAGHRGAGASNARRARSARATARCAPHARPGHLRLGRLVTAVPPRPGGAPPAARRRRSLRRVDEGGAGPLPAHPPARGRRDRRPGDADGVRARPAHAGAGEPTTDDGQLRRQARRHAHRDRREAQDDRARTCRGQRPRVREPRRRGRQAPPARRGRVRSGSRAQPLDRPRRTSTSGRRTTASPSASPARSRGRSPASRRT